MGHSPGLILFSYTLHVPQIWNSEEEQQAGSLQVLRGSQELWVSVPVGEGQRWEEVGGSPGPREQDVEGVG